MKVSVIVSCFNQGKYLSDALDSVLTQTYTDWECVVINDGSTDNTESVALSYVRKDSRFHYIYQLNQGVCVARNCAIRSTSGDYILCLDADDKISSTYIELAAKKMDERCAVKLVACNYQYFGKRNRKVLLEPYSLERLMGHNLFVNCSMFRRTDFDIVDGFNKNMKHGLEDWDFWLSILSLGGEVEYLSGIHFYYRAKCRNESRNLSVTNDMFQILREQIWRNHRDLYMQVYSSPLNSLEYLAVVRSREYVLGRKLLAPLRKVLKMIAKL